VIPRPHSSRPGGPGATLSDGLVVTAPDGEAAKVADLLASELAQATGWAVHRGAPGTPGNGGVVRLEVPGGAGAADRHFPDATSEAYRLTVDRDGTTISATTGAGLFYGTRTLLQLLPPELWRQAPVSPAPTVALEGTAIDDSPRFGWRGVNLDVSRHFFPKRFLLELVDLAARYKFNVLHLHLTDDQGWRLPVDRYPLLTEVGAWRRESPLGHNRDERSDGTPHGGHYSHADMAELVAYAARRYVTVVPEIDMPGHMQAAIAAYPQLGNTGEQLEVMTRWGVSDHVLNLDDTTVRFCADVLEEVMGLFPGRYVHIGGDECPTTEWAASDRARQRCQELGLTGVGQLQGWFTAQMAAVLQAKGRALVGWDEILDAGAPPGAAIMCWRRDEALRAATQAARSGHDVIMAPEPRTYFDWANSEGPAEPVAIRAAITTEKVYSFDPVPDGLEPGLEERVLGGQCQLWSEYVPTPEHAEYMYFPRACALAEALWSSGPREWDEFARRLAAHIPYLDARGVNYRPLAGPNPGQARIWTGPQAQA
jgi:hexosaminidase